MRATAKVVRLSSKGQVVIPIAVRRRLGLKAGQPLAVRTGSGEKLILSPVDRDGRAVDDMLHRLRKAAQRIGRDLVAELHARRQSDRDREAAKHDHGRR